MFVFLLRRSIALSAVAVGVSFGVFAFVYGGGALLHYAMYEAGGGVTKNPEAYESAVSLISETEGLDRPIVIQFADYLCGGLCVPDAKRDGVIRGDFGRSWRSGRDISSYIRVNLPVSAQLGLAALVVLYAVGIPLGTLAAVKRGTWTDRWITVGFIGVKSVPVFVLGPAVMIVFVHGLKIDPPVGLLIVDSVGVRANSGWEGLFTVSYILAVVLAALVAMPGVVRTTRAGVIDALNQDYVRTARAKGLPERMVLRRHVMGTALTPLVTGLVPTLGALLTGVVIVEVLFGIEGFAYLLFSSIEYFFSVRGGWWDWSIMMAGIVLGLAAWAVCSLAADLLHWALDPRIRHDGAVSRSRTAGRALAV